MLYYPVVYTLITDEFFSSIEICMKVKFWYVMAHTRHDGGVLGYDLNMYRILEMSWGQFMLFLESS